MKSIVLTHFNLRGWNHESDASFLQSVTVLHGVNGRLVFLQKHSDGGLTSAGSFLDTGTVRLYQAQLPRETADLEAN